MSKTPETDAVEKHCEELVRAYHQDRMRVGDDRELAKVMIQVTRELLTVSRALERKLAAAPEVQPSKYHGDAEAIVDCWVAAVREQALELGLPDDESKGSTHDWRHIKAWISRRLHMNSRPINQEKP